MLARVFFVAGLAAGLPALAGTPAGMVANVYRLTEAAAVMSVCYESPAYRKLPEDKARQLTRLAGRIGDLVRNIGTHYRDDGLYPTFEATRAQIAGGPELRNLVKTKYEDCGDELLRKMEDYVAENEKLINGYLARQSAAGKSR